MTEDDPRVDAILKAIVALSRRDFGTRLEVQGSDGLDAIASGLNMLAEELEAGVASRRDLEVALAERKAAETKLVHGGRLAVLGQLTGGVAHEINNPTTWVSLGLTIVERELGALREDLGRGTLSLDRAARRLDVAGSALRDAAEGMDRIRTVAADLRAFARADDEAAEPVALADAVRAAARLAGPSFRAHARLELELGEAPPVDVNRGRVAQVVTNLLINAAHAVLDREGEQRIRVTTRAELGGALLVVEDSGPGVPEAIRDKIFLPFFTTKTAELGTGLGLALVRQIVERCSGDIRVGGSELGGARFEVWLPGTRTGSLGPPAGAAASRARRAGRRRILVVDDEPAILRALRGLFHQEVDVEIASGGRAAIERLREDIAFDLVLCDINMPEVDGVDVFQWIELHAPLLAGRVVLCTGAVPSPRVSAFIARTHPLVLEKPISRVRLEAVLSGLASSASERPLGG